MTDDDAALAEVNDWISTNAIPVTNKVDRLAFQARIKDRFDTVKKEYDHFLRNHPDSAHGFLAYGSFLNDIGDEEGAAAEYENSRQLDPNNPAVWNNLANYYGEYGPVTNAFVDYAEAIHLNPNEPVYYQNFATTVYLFRKDVREFYNINEQQTFDKALGLYRQAMKLAPDDLVLATDYAESYYGIRPLRTNDALMAWTNALNITRDDNEREGILVHLTRIKIAAGFFEEAQAQLDTITNPAYADMKTRLERSLKEHKYPATNSVESIPTSGPGATTNGVMVSALTLITNGVPALTNPPVLVKNIATVLTNVPPTPPGASVESSNVLSAPISLR
jgi:tetratricopeptide (TPR) repeat protein